MSHSDSDSESLKQLQLLSDNGINKLKTFISNSFSFQLNRSINVLIINLFVCFFDCQLAQFNVMKKKYTIVESQRVTIIFIRHRSFRLLNVRGDKCSFVKNS